MQLSKEGNEKRSIFWFRIYSNLVCWNFGIAIFTYGEKEEDEEKQAEYISSTLRLSNKKSSLSIQSKQ